MGSVVVVVLVVMVVVACTALTTVQVFRLLWWFQLYGGGVFRCSLGFVCPKSGQMAPHGPTSDPNVAITVLTTVLVFRL